MSFAILLIGVAVLGCLGVVVAIMLAVARMSVRGAAHHEKMHCPHCRGVVSPLDEHCPRCGHPLRPQEIEKLDPEAR